MLPTSDSPCQVRCGLTYNTRAGPPVRAWARTRAAIFRLGQAGTADAYCVPSLCPSPGPLATRVTGREARHGIEILQVP
jgi:hypothetical protein